MSAKHPSPYADKGVSVVDAMLSPDLFAPMFTPAESWAGWRVFLKAFSGEPLTPEELVIYREHTGRQEPPSEPAREGALVCGRQAGKSRIASLLGVHAAAFTDHTGYLAPGGTARVVILAQHKEAGGVIFDYCRALLESVDGLASMIDKVTDGGDKRIIKLSNGIDIAVYAASKRAVRGPQVIACVADESAHWWSDEMAANPDTQVLKAVRPGMLHVPSAFLLQLSSPYGRRGALWQAYDKHFGREGDQVVIWQSTTQAMYPGADAALIAQAYADDPEDAAAEYGGLFRADISALVTHEVLAAAIVLGRHELPPAPGVLYTCFVDPSGMGHDSYTVGIAHAEGGGRAILDLVREYRPETHSATQAVAEIAGLCAAYGIHTVTGDNYGHELAQAPYHALHLGYRVADLTRSKIYCALVPLMNNRLVELPEDARLKSQLLGLTRRPGRGGAGDIVDHGRGQHDDKINSAAGALVYAALHPPRPEFATGEAEIAWEESRRGVGSMDRKTIDAAHKLEPLIFRSYTEHFGPERGAQLAQQKIALAHAHAREDADDSYARNGEEDPDVLEAWLEEALPGLARMRRAQVERGYDLKSGQEW